MRTTLRERFYLYFSIQSYPTLRDLYDHHTSSVHEETGFLCIRMLCTVVLHVIVETVQTLCQNKWLKRESWNQVIAACVYVVGRKWSNHVQMHFLVWCHVTLMCGKVNLYRITSCTSFILYISNTWMSLCWYKLYGWYITMCHICVSNYCVQQYQQVSYAHYQ